MPADASTFIAQQTLTASVPLILAGLGELVAEKAGVINIGIEGTMLAGCIAAYSVAALTGSGWAGVGAAIGAGLVLAAIFAFVCVWARADQIVAGTALNLLAAGLSTTIWRLIERSHSVLPEGVGFNRVAVAGLADIPFVGPVFFQQYTFFYVLAILCVGTIVILIRTRAGVVIAALGDAPAAADAAGLSVRWWRTSAVLLAGATAGAAGAYLSIMRNHNFAVDMTGGQGFLVIALVVFGRWRVSGLIAGCVLFGLLDSVQMYLKGFVAVQHVPDQFFKVLPYLATLVALALLTRADAGPLYLGRPWPEERAD